MHSIELTEDLLKSNGWAYLFDISQEIATEDEDFVHAHISNIYLSAIEALTKSNSKKLKKGPMLVWNCLKKVVGDNFQLTDAYVLFVTPYYHVLTGRDTDPVIDKLRHQKGYIRMTGATPLLEGAAPACLFENGEVYPIKLDQELISQLSDLFEEHQYMLSLSNPGMTIQRNPYEA